MRHAVAAPLRGAHDLLKRGIQQALELQQAVVRQGVSLVEKRGITKVRVFRYAHLKNLSGTDLLLFTQPMALAKLGRFLVDAHVVRPNPAAHACSAEQAR